MKTKFLIIIALLSLFSCKDGVKKDSVNKLPVKEPNQLIVGVTLKTSKSGKFKLFANNVFLNNDQEMSISITQKLKPSTDFKELVFEFPEGIVPDYSLGFSLGDKVEKEVEIIEATIEFDTLSYKISKENVLDYFTLNPYVDFDEKSNMLITKKVNDKHYPKLFIKRKFLDQISGF